jgi:hypothetical protein
VTQDYTPDGKSRVYKVPDFGLANGPTNFEQYTDQLDDLLDTGFAAKLAGVKADTAPATPATNDVWLDTSGAAGVWKIWNGSAWVSFSGSSPAVVSSTTGSPTITSETVNGVTYDIYKWTGNGSITIGTAGLAEILLVGGGGGGYPALGTVPGAGAYIRDGVHPLPAGTLTVTVGGGGAAANDNSHMGGSSVLDTLVTGVAGPGRAGWSGTFGVTPFTSMITGAALYVSGRKGATPAPVYGGGSADSNGTGQAGVVIVRVAR